MATRVSAMAHASCRRRWWPRALLMIAGGGQCDYNDDSCIVIVACGTDHARGPRHEGLGLAGAVQTSWATIIWSSIGE